MKKVLIIFLGLVLFVPFVLSNKSNVAACGSYNPSEGYVWKDYIFSGKVSKIVDNPLDKENEEVTIEVYDIWKGEVPNIFQITVKKVDILEAVCEGYIFEEGGEYLIYASKGDNNIYGVYGTTELKYSKDRLAILNNPLPDSKKSVFRPYITDLFFHGIVGGFSDGEYKVDRPVTRAELAKMIVKGFDIPSQAVGPQDRFPDTSDIDLELLGSINTLKALGVVSGEKDGTFRPNDYITRGAVAKMIVESLKLRGVQMPEITYTDGGQDYAGNTFADHIIVLMNVEVNGQHIMKGYNNWGTEFRPNNFITRGEIAKVVSLGRKTIKVVGQEFCEVYNGNWNNLDKVCSNFSSSEIDDIKKQMCESSGGEFNDCGSSCGLNPDPGMSCVTVCVPICTFPSSSSESEMVYKFIGSSVAPEDNRNYIITINEERVNIQVDSYGDVLRVEEYPFSKDNFQALIGIYRHVNLNITERLGLQNCVGGTTQQLQVKVNSKLEFDGSNYYCGEEVYGNIDGDFEFLVDAIHQLIPFDPISIN